MTGLRGPLRPQASVSPARVVLLCSDQLSPAQVLLDTLIVSLATLSPVNCVLSGGEIFPPRFVVTVVTTLSASLNFCLVRRGLSSVTAMLRGSLSF